MHRFEVLANSELIGHTELERGDPPMGVAFGIFLAQAAYGLMREVIILGEGRNLESIRLTVRVAATG